MNRNESFEDLRNTANYFVELEEENKKLKESLGKMTKRNVKASVYIEEHSLNFNGESEIYLEVEEVKDLYKILKGEE